MSNSLTTYTRCLVWIFLNTGLYRIQSISSQTYLTLSYRYVLMPLEQMLRLPNQASLMTLLGSLWMGQSMPSTQLSVNKGNPQAASFFTLCVAHILAQHQYQTEANPAEN